MADNELLEPLGESLDELNVRVKILEQQMTAMINHYNYIATKMDWMRFKLSDLEGKTKQVRPADSRVNPLRGG